MNNKLIERYGKDNADKIIHEESSYSKEKAARERYGDVYKKKIETRDYDLSKDERLNGIIEAYRAKELEEKKYWANFEEKMAFEQAFAQKILETYGEDGVEAYEKYLADKEAKQYQEQLNGGNR